MKIYSASLTFMVTWALPIVATTTTLFSVARATSRALGALFRPSSLPLRLQGFIPRSVETFNLLFHETRLRSVQRLALTNPQLALMLHRYPVLPFTRFSRHLAVSVEHPPAAPNAARPRPPPPPPAPPVAGAGGGIGANPAPPPPPLLGALPFGPQALAPVFRHDPYRACPEPRPHEVQFVVRPETALGGPLSGRRPTPTRNLVLPGLTPLPFRGSAEMFRYVQSLGFSPIRNIQRDPAAAGPQAVPPYHRPLAYCEPENWHAINALLRTHFMREAILNAPRGCHMADIYGHPRTRNFGRPHDRHISIVGQRWDPSDPARGLLDLSATHGLMIHVYHHTSPQDCLARAREFAPNVNVIYLVHDKFLGSAGACPGYNWWRDADGDIHASTDRTWNHPDPRWWNQAGAVDNLSWYTKSSVQFGTGCITGLTILRVHEVPLNEFTQPEPADLVENRPVPSAFVCPYFDIPAWADPLIRFIWPLAWPMVHYPVREVLASRTHHAHRGASNFTPGDFTKHLALALRDLEPVQTLDHPTVLHAISSLAVRSHFSDLASVNRTVRTGTHVSRARGTGIAEEPNYKWFFACTAAALVFPVFRPWLKQQGVLGLGLSELWIRVGAPIAEENAKHFWARKLAMPPIVAGALFGCLEYWTNDYSPSLAPTFDPRRLGVRIALHGGLASLGLPLGMLAHVAWNNACYSPWFQRTVISPLFQLNLAQDAVAAVYHLRLSHAGRILLTLGLVWTYVSHIRVVNPTPTPVTRDRPCAPMAFDIDPTVEITYKGKTVTNFSAIVNGLDNPAPTGRGLTWACQPTDDADIWSPAGTATPYHFATMIATRLGKQLYNMNGGRMGSIPWTGRAMHRLIDRVVVPKNRSYDHLLEVWLEHQKTTGKFGRYKNLLDSNPRYRTAALRNSKKTPCALKQDEVLFKPRHRPKGLYGRTVECVDSLVNMCVGPYDHFLTGSIKTMGNSLELYREGNLYSFPALGWTNVVMDECYNHVRCRGARILLVHGDDVFYQDFSTGDTHEHDLSSCDHSLQTEAMDYEQRLFTHWTNRLGLGGPAVDDYHRLSRNVARSTRHIGDWTVTLDQRPTGSTRTSVGNTMLVMNVFTEAYLAPDHCIGAVRNYADQHGLVLTGSSCYATEGYSTFLKGIFMACEDGQYHWFKLPSNVMKALKCNSKRGMHLLMRTKRKEMLTDKEASRRWLAVMSHANMSMPQIPVVRAFFTSHAEHIPLLTPPVSVLPYAFEDSTAETSVPTGDALRLLGRRYSDRADVFDLLGAELASVRPGGAFVSDTLALMVRADY